MGICKTGTGWLRMADADGGWKNADGTGTGRWDHRLNLMGNQVGFVLLHS